MNDWSTLLLTAFLSSGSVAAIFGYLASRRSSKIDYSESVAKTLSEFNDLLKKEITEVRGENVVLRKRVRELEDRVASLERDGRSNQ